MISPSSMFSMSAIMSLYDYQPGDSRCCHAHFSKPLSSQTNETIKKKQKKLGQCLAGQEQCTDWSKVNILTSRAMLGFFLLLSISNFPTSYHWTNTNTCTLAFCSFVDCNCRWNSLACCLTWTHIKLQVIPPVIAVCGYFALRLFWNMSKLRVIDASFNRIECLPERIDNSFVKRLFLQHNRLKDIPPAFLMRSPK